MSINGKQILAGSVPASALNVTDEAKYFMKDGSRALGGDIDANSLYTIKNLQAPGDPNEAARKADVDAMGAGLAWKQPVVVRAQGNVNIASAPATIDGIAPTGDKRFLLDLQTDLTQNGVYLGQGVGSAMIRATDCDTGPELVSAAIFVSGGTNADTMYTCTNDSITQWTTEIVFVQFSSIADLNARHGLIRSGNILDVETGAGVTFDGNDKLTLNIEANSGLSQTLGASSSGLGVLLGANMEFSSGAIRPAASLAGDGLTGGGASALAVGAGDGISVSSDAVAVKPEDFAGNGLSTSGGDLIVKADGDTITVGVGGIKSAVPTTTDKDAASLVTTGNYQDTGVDITAAPKGDSYPSVSVNGIGISVGDGVRTKECYFSVDAGANARALNAIVAGDSLYFNGTIAGYDLAITDKISLEYAI